MPIQQLLGHFFALENAHIDPMIIKFIMGRLPAANDLHGVLLPILDTLLMVKIFGIKEVVPGSNSPNPILGLASMDQAGLYMIHLELLNVENYIRTFILSDNQGFEPKENLYSASSDKFNLCDNLPDKPKFKKISAIWNNDMGQTNKIRDTSAIHELEFFPKTRLLLYLFLYP